MILSCPNCGARFRIASDQLGLRGRKVRCSKCQHRWHASPEDAMEEADSSARQAPRQAEPEPQLAAADDGDSGRAGEAPAPSMDAPDALDRPPLDFESFEEVRARARSRNRNGGARPGNSERETRRRPPILGWAVFLVVVALVAGGVWAGRHMIVERFPQAAALYKLAGVSVNTVAPGLELRNVRRSQEAENGGRVLVIEGEIVNTSDGTRSVPDLRVTLFDASGKELVAWRVRAAETALAPGGQTTFRTRRNNLPDSARELSLRFAPPRS